MQGLGGKTTNDQGREQKGRQRGEIGEELHDEIIAWFVVARGEQEKKRSGMEVLLERDVVEWLAAKDWNGDKAPRNVSSMCRAKESDRKKKRI